MPLLATCPAIAHGQETITLDVVVSEADEITQTAGEIPDDRLEMPIVVPMDDNATEVSEQLQKVTSARIADNGNRLQRKSFAFRGAAAQDIVIRYMGVPINALSDASADLALIPAPLIEKSKIYGSGAAAAPGAVGALVDLEPVLTAPMLAKVTVGTLHDFSIFAQGSKHFDTGMVQGAAWGDQSPGKFQYYDAQDTRQIREHNEASRIGGQLLTQWDFHFVDVTAFSLLSYIDREEAGQSEYPAKYRDASQKVWLSLSGLRAVFTPFALGKAFSGIELAFSERASGDIYDNPTAFIGGAHTHSDYRESRSTAEIKANFIVGDWSRTTLRMAYEYQDLTSEMLAFSHKQEQEYSRHLVSASAQQAFQFFDDTLKLAGTLQVDWVEDLSPIWSPHFGVIWQPFSSLSLWGSASMAGRFPSFDESYYRTEYLRGNASLDPQKSKLFEVGIAYRPIAWLQAAITGFYNLHEDLIRFIAVTPYLYEAKNIDGATARGFDTSIVVSDWYGLSAKAEYTYADVMTDDGFPMPTAAKHHVMGEIAYRHSWLRASFDIHYQSEVARNMAGTDFTPSKLRLNLHAGMQLYPNLWLSLDVTNLLNDMKSADVLQRPLPGRQGWVSLRYCNNE